MNRTHNNGELRLENVGQTVELKGWVAKTVSYTHLTLPTIGFV